MKMYFTVTSKIQDGIHCLIEDNYKRDAIGKEYFRFLMSQRPSTTTLLLRLLPLVNNVSVLNPSPVVSFGCIHPLNSLAISWILCVLHSRTIPTMNSLTRLIPSFMRISVELSSSTSNPVLLRNVVSPILYTKEWMANGIVPLPFPCRIMPQILSLFRTQAVMNLWMPPKFRTVFQWI